MIYISEAHADDEWPISNIIKIKQTKTVEDRITVVKKNMADSQLNIYVDDVTLKNFETTYCGWPERGYIIENNKIQHICYAQPDDMINWRGELQTWITDFIGK